MTRSLNSSSQVSTYLQSKWAFFFEPACRVWRENARARTHRLRNEQTGGWKFFLVATQVRCRFYASTLSVGANKGVWKYILMYVFTVRTNIVDFYTQCIVVRVVVVEVEL
jgi:hypothetical protein